MNLLLKGTGALLGILVVAAAAKTYKSTTSFQMGASGVAMQLTESRERLVEKAKANEVPPALPAASQDGVLAVNAYKNVQVLGHVSSGEFTRLMTAITTWVAPNQGCAYCHAAQKDAKGNVVKDEDGNPQADLNRMDSDELYTKRVARRMIQMTMRINADWQLHVAKTGVTCYTCHHGNPVPVNIWYDVNEGEANREIGRTAGQNAPSTVAGLASLPTSSLRPFLVGDEDIRVQSTEAVGSTNRASIKQTEWTYSLMMHMSKSLGVNCTYCHNTRSMGAWGTSPTTRTTAWYGIRMVRELNRNFLEPLAASFPPERLGPMGDGPKVNCATCHAGAYKPLLGVSMLADYQVLAAPKAQPPKTADLGANPAPAGTTVPPVALPAPESLAVTAVDAGAAVPDAGAAGPKPPSPMPAPGPTGDGGARRP